MKEHSNDLHQLLIKHFLKSDTEREIVLISLNTVHSRIEKYKYVANMWRRGRKLLILIELFKEKSRQIVENLRCQ